MRKLNRITYGLAAGLFFSLNLQAQQNIADCSLLDRYVADEITVDPEGNETLPFLTDKEESTFFIAANFPGEVRLQLAMNTPVVVKGYSLVSSDDAASDPKTFRLYGSNDGSTWNPVGGSVLGHNFSGRYLSETFPLNTNVLPYRYFRLTVTQINGGRDLKIAELQLFGYPVPLPDDLTQHNQTSLTGEFPGSGGDLLAQVMNNDINTLFRQNNTTSCWMQYELETPANIGSYALISSSRNNPENNLGSWRLLASNDGNTWDILDTRTNKNTFNILSNMQIYRIAGGGRRHNWAAYADFAQQTLIDLFWKNYGNDGRYLIHSYHPNPDSINAGFNYWWMAHALDVLTDGLIRTGNTDYKTKMRQVYNGMKNYGKGSLRNNFYDDMEWMGLACLRAHEADRLSTQWKESAIQLWDWIKQGWNDNHGGGIQWVSDQPASKNACSNAPAIILAARLYRETGNQDYLDWAIRIFDWMNNALIFPENGLVKDSYDNNLHSWTLTYNQGVWIGACLELYRITGEPEYYTIAMKTADYVVDDREKFSPYGILYNNESGDDGGLFKGIFMRYLSQWILSGELDKQRRDKFVGYLIENGKSLWESALLRSENMFGNTWYARPAAIKTSDEKNAGYDASIHLSALMLFELLDELNRKGFIPEGDLHPAAFDNKNNAYKYFRLEITANRGGNAVDLTRWQLFATAETGINNPALINSAVKIHVQDRRLILSGQTGKALHYRICNTGGQILQDGILQEQVLKITLSPGIYIVTFDNTCSQKVII